MDAQLVENVWHRTQICSNIKEIYENTPQNRQAAVAILFLSNHRFPNGNLQKEHYRSYIPLESLRQATQKEDFKIKVLFCQRQFRATDLHSGQLCFPGGKVDEGENDFQAAIRETYEEIGIDLHKVNCGYLGRLPRCIYTTKKNRKIRTNAYVFLIYLQDYQLNINKEELLDYRWVELDYFRNFQNQYLRTTKFSKEYADHMIGTLLKNYPKLQNYLIARFKDGYFIMVDVGMKQHLFGLTLYLFCQLLQLSNIKDKRIDQLLECSSRFNIQFRNSPISNILFPYLYRKYYIKDRVDPSRYIIQNSKL